ncbi:hypothetical protein LY78DRAFT_443762 [Colletotrichum sublineola]|nr:hypothetical protein LY78DRAFT_443762 [Colletotrichum sublineola]
MYCAMHVGLCILRLDDLTMYLCFHAVLVQKEAPRTRSKATWPKACCSACLPFNYLFFVFISSLKTETPRRRPQRQQLVCVRVFHPSSFFSLPRLPCLYLFSTSVYLRYLLLPRASSVVLLFHYSFPSQFHSETLLRVPSPFVLLRPTSFNPWLPGS